MGIINFIIVLAINIIWVVQWGSVKNVYEHLFKFNDIVPKWLVVFCWIYEFWGIFNLLYWLNDVLYR
jgi:hypothetical protein